MLNFYNLKLNLTAFNYLKHTALILDTKLTMVFILTWPLTIGEKVILLKLLGPRFSFVLLKLLPDWLIISLIRCLESILLLHTSKPVFINYKIK